jgi:thymidylate kinase
VIVVLLGPDGCGKSSVLERLERDLAKRFAEVRVLHLRPRLGRGGPSGGKTVANPHGPAPRGFLMSALKLFFLLFDYGTLYPWIWRQRTAPAPGGLLLFDRYYHDILVDPRRYRYGAPLWLARSLGWFVPKPDLWILLDAPTEILRARKQEVSESELDRQRRTYRDLVKCFSHGQVIDAARPLEAVSREIEGLILARAR